MTDSKGPKSLVRQDDPRLRDKRRPYYDEIEEGLVLAGPEEGQKRFPIFRRIKKKDLSEAGVSGSLQEATEIGNETDRDIRLTGSDLIFKNGTAETRLRSDGAISTELNLPLRGGRLALTEDIVPSDYVPSLQEVTGVGSITNNSITLDNSTLEFINYPAGGGPIPGETPLRTPEGLIVEVIEGGLRISWDKSLGALAYRIFRRDPGLVPQLSWYQKGPDLEKTFYEDRELTHGLTYRYKVQAVGALDKVSDFSQDLVITYQDPKVEDTIPPSPPENLIAVPIIRGNYVTRVVLSWSKSVEFDTDSYQLFRRRKASDEWLLFEERPASYTAEVSIPFERPVEDGLYVEFMIRAVDQKENISADSVPVVLNLDQVLAPSVDPPEMPTGFEGEDSQGELFLSWDFSPSPLIRHWVIEYLDPVQLQWLPLKTVTEPGYRGEPPFKRVEIDYRVYAVDEYDQSGAPATGVRVEVKQGNPENLVHTVYDGAIGLEWDEIDDPSLEEYQVWRSHLEYPREGGTWTDENGKVVIDVARADISGTQWVKEKHPGSSGEGNLRWTGPNLFATNQAQQGNPIAFELDISNPGTYNLNMNAFIPGSAGTGEINDVWFRINGGSWRKYFSYDYQRNYFAFGGQEEFPPGSEQVRPTTVTLNSGKNVFELSGRSNEYRIDRVHLYQSGSEGDQSSSTPETYVEEVDETAEPEEVYTRITGEGFTKTVVIDRKVENGKAYKYEVYAKYDWGRAEPPTYTDPPELTPLSGLGKPPAGGSPGSRSGLSGYITHTFGDRVLRLSDGTPFPIIQKNSPEDLLRWDKDLAWRKQQVEYHVNLTSGNGLVYGWNCLYVIMFNDPQGDGRNTSHFASSGGGYDYGSLNPAAVAATKEFFQWIWDTHGLLVEACLFEYENSIGVIPTDNNWELYSRYAKNMAEAFIDCPNVIWNLGEETRTPHFVLEAMAAAIKQVNPDVPVVLHNTLQPGDDDRLYDPFLWNRNLTGASFQTINWIDVHAYITKWRNRIRNKNAGSENFFIYVSETGYFSDGIPRNVDPYSSTGHSFRRYVSFPAMMISGGLGGYYGINVNGQNRDTNYEDDGSEYRWFAEMCSLCQNLMEKCNGYDLPVLEGRSRSETSNGIQIWDPVIGEDGVLYATYLPLGRGWIQNVPPGEYEVTRYHVVTGEEEETATVNHPGGRLDFANESGSPDGFVDAERFIIIRGQSAEAVNSTLNIAYLHQTSRNLRNFARLAPKGDGGVVESAASLANAVEERPEQFRGTIRPQRLSKNRVYLLPDRSGTLVLKEDLPNFAPPEDPDIGIGEIPTLKQVVDKGNTTDQDVVLDGSDLIYSQGAYSGRLNVETLGDDRIWTLPNKSGTIALSDDITVFSWDATLVVDPVTDKDPVLNGSSLIFRNGTNDGTFQATPTGARTWTLPDASGTIALVTDLTSPTLQEVTEAGGTTFEDITFNGITTFNEEALFNGGVWVDSSIHLAGLPFKTLIFYNTLSNYGELRANPTGIKLWDLPNASGTLALTSDIGTDSLQDVTSSGNDTDQDIILISSSLIFFNDPQFSGLTLTASPTATRTITLPDNSGTACVAAATGSLTLSTTGVMSFDELTLSNKVDSDGDNLTGTLEFVTEDKGVGLGDWLLSANSSEVVSLTHRNGGGKVFDISTTEITIYRDLIPEGDGDPDLGKNASPWNLVYCKLAFGSITGSQFNPVMGDGNELRRKTNVFTGNIQIPGGNAYAFRNGICEGIDV